jgi:hypothetical protein
MALGEEEVEALVLLEVLLETVLVKLSIFTQKMG